MKTFQKARSSRKFHAHDSSAVLESLEPRQMLTADLAVSFQEFSVPSPMVPGDRFDAGVFVTNNGPMAALGFVSINFFLSTDTNFDVSDINIGSFPNLNISLDASGEFSIGNFSAQVHIPATTAAGNYFFLARITPNNQVNDTNQSNNIVASDDFFPVEIKFGAIPGRTTTAILEQLDPEGTIVQFQLFDGGMGTISQDDDGRFDITVTGAGANSQLGIATSGGDGMVDIDDINIAGSISSITATSARLFGSLSVSGTLGTITLGNVGGTTAEVPITIGQAGINTVISLGAVTNASISTPGGIQSLTVTSWLDTNASPVDLISAQWLGSLTTTGNFNASLDLSGRTGANSLGDATIGGSLTGGSWRVIGRGGNIQAFTTTAKWSASFTQFLTSLSTTRIFRGTVAAKNILGVNIGFDMLGAKILAGANLGSDGRLGGTGDAADRFAFGRIDSLTVGGKVRNSIVGAGLDPVNGVFNDGNDRIKQPAKSRMGDVVIVGNVAPAARIVAGRFTGDVTVRGMTINPAADARFRVTDTVNPTAEFISADTTVAPSLIRVRFGDNQGVLRSSIGDGDIRIDAPGGAFSLNVELVSVSRATDGTPITATYRFTPPDGSWDASENGTYTVVLLASAVTDVAGNPVGGGMAVTLGTFDVLV